MKRIIIALGLAAPVPALAFGPLIDAATLHAALEDDAPAVLDIRAQGPKGYDGGHVPGALNTPYAKFRGPADNPGKTPDAASLTATLQEAGLEPDDAVVIVHAGADETDFGAAARVYWTLKSSGLKNLAILNGGLAAWKQAGYALETAPASAIRSDIVVTFSDQWTADAETIQAVIDGQREALLLDARPEEFWKGEVKHKAAAKPGTLPQSRYFEHSNWFGGGPAIVNAEAARKLAEEAGLTGGQTLVSFCNTGHWAATNWFALSELAGVENVKLYPESMVGWSHAGGAMENTPGVLRNLLNQISGAVGN